MALTRKQIENIVIISLAVVTAGIMAYVPLSSYIPYKEQQDQIMSAAIERDNKTLKSIEAKLKDGVEIFNNGISTVRNEDVEVYALYGGKYADPVKVLLEPEDYVVSVPADFAVKGGTVSVSYMGKTVEFVVELTKIALSEIVIKENPYKVTYAVGETFDPTGLILLGVNNDGTTIDISSSEVTCSDGSNLQLNKKSVTVKYLDKEIQIPVSVVQTLDNGAITSLSTVGEYRVNQGSTFSSPVDVLAHYAKTGNRQILSSSQYKLEGSNEVAKLGKVYSLKAILNSDTSISTNIPVIVSYKYEAETAVLRNTKVTTETEYYLNSDNTFTEGSDITFAATTGKVTASGDTCSVKFTVTSETACVSRLILKSSNGYYVDGIMKPIQLNHVMDVIVNDEVNKLSDDVVIKGTPQGTTTEVYNVYNEYDLGYVQFKAGSNTIELYIHGSEYGEMTSWNEPPCSFNFDYLTFETYDHKHNLEHVTAKDSTCTAKGNVDHYYCTICKQHYSDANATKHINSVEIEETGHKYSEWTYDENNHTSTCVNGKGCEESKTEKHSYETVFKNNKFYEECTVCDYERVIEGEIKSLVIDEGFKPVYGTKLSATPVYAVIGNKEYQLTSDLFTITNSNDANNEYYLFGTNNITVTLKGNASIKVEKTYEIATEYSSVLKYVDLVNENGKAYWTFEFENRGYTKDQYRLFDGTFDFVPESVEETITTLKFKVNVTNYAKKTYYPHASYTVNGKTTLYYAHKNGDLLVNDSTWNKNKTFKLGSKTYKLSLEYDMAVLVVA